MLHWANSAATAFLKNHMNIVNNIGAHQHTHSNTRQTKRYWQNRSMSILINVSFAVLKRVLCAVHHISWETECAYHTVLFVIFRVESHMSSKTVMKILRTRTKMKWALIVIEVMHTWDVGTKQWLAPIRSHGDRLTSECATMIRAWKMTFSQGATRKFKWNSF